MAELTVLSKEEAIRSTGYESAPAAEVAAPLGCMVKVPRMAAVPLTSRLAAGAVVPMPTLPPDSTMAEGSRLHGAENLATWLAVPAPSLVRVVQAASGITPAGESSLG